MPRHCLVAVIIELQLLITVPPLPLPVGVIRVQREFEKLIRLFKVLNIHCIDREKLL